VLAGRPVTGRYDYEPWVWDEFAWMQDLAMPGHEFQRADRGSDYGGIDAAVDGCLCLAYRARFSGRVPDEITIRETEILKIHHGTFARYLLYLWCDKDRRRSLRGVLIDVDRMAARINPPLHEREVHPNHDGGPGFVGVHLRELGYANAILRRGDRHYWQDAIPGALRGIDEHLRGVHS
jgi:hypothetical protein